MHANTQVPKAIGFERIAELTGDETYHAAGSFFWDIVTGERSLAFGGNSRREHFPSKEACTDFINDIDGPESCNTNNMLKLTEDLHRRNPEARYADYYELATFNHILSTQHSEHGGYVYFTPARPRHYRNYSAPNEAMWCCVGTGMENHGKYGQFIYTSRHDALYVNLFTASELESMLNINQKNEQTWFQLIQIYLSEQNYPKLMDVTARAIESLPKVAQWYFYRGITQFQLKEYEAALKTNQQALEVISDKEMALKTDIYAQMGDIYYKLGNKEEAFASYDQALKINPGNVFVMNNYAYYLSEENVELKKAESMSAKTVEKEPDNTTYLDTYAWIFYKQGNYSLAKFYIERAIDNLKADYDAGVIYDHYGDILWKSGDETKAVEMWKKSLEFDADSEILKQKIKEGLK
jgi:tetratricopeptide (TPR) repeat protein